MSHNLIYAWLIPILPLVGFLINGLIGARIPKALSGGLATALVFGSFAISCSLLFGVILPASPDSRQFVVPGMTWFNISGDPTGIHDFRVNFELLIDPLSILMMMIITGVGGLIHLYSTAYMASESGYSRFFTYLNLFIFFMLLLVMGNNFLVLFVGWEGVGLCSYLLIGYYYEKQSAGDAAKKAFIVNRIGDVGVLIGMFMIFQYFHTLDFVKGGSGVEGILSQAATVLPPLGGAVVATMMLMLFFGATGKSAQIPLYTWLPDAMEGPTPVSALIHAATMVTAGVYMVSRAHSLFEQSDLTMAVIAGVGILTALLAATIGLVQNDIKRVLAYSTVSQLGYMFAACGAGMFAAGMFHVMTHAFFKACLFLCSGSVIHAMEHAMHAKSHDAHAAAADDGHGDTAHDAVLAAEAGNGHADVSATGADPHDPQDMRNMGGLWTRIPKTGITMLLATLAIAGVFPFAGFWSKDEILWSLFNSHGGKLLYGIGAATALLTAFYMMRLIMKTFFVPAQTDAAKHATDSSPAMIIPLVILAALSVVAGWPMLPLSFEKFQDFLGSTVATPGYAPKIDNPSLEPILGWGLFAVIAVILIVCVSAYKSKSKGKLLSPEQSADRAPMSLGWWQYLLLNKYFVDEAYNFWFVKLGKKFANFMWKTMDVEVVDGIVNGVGGFTNWAGSRLRLIQSGLVRNYAYIMVIGIIGVLALCVAGASGGH